MTSRPSELAVGVLSGTSADGIDVAIVRDPGGRPCILSAGTYAYSSRTRRRLLGVLGASSGRTTPVDLDLLATLHREIAEDFAAAVRKRLATARIPARRVTVVGSHGQTVRHLPRVMSWQLGSPAVLAARLGIPVAADFRPDDVAVGGEGAPFVPVLDRMLLGEISLRRASGCGEDAPTGRRSRPRNGANARDGAGSRLGALNLGGIANLTVVAEGRLEGAWDCGPANGPVDAAARLLLGRSCDRNARVASRGRVDERLLGRLLKHPYFARRPPKSTGLEEFGEGFVRALRIRGRSLCDADLLATLVELSARTTAAAIRRARLDVVYVSGGGWRNPLLVARLKALCAPTVLDSTQVLGVDPDAKEAVLFAVLGWKRWKGEPVDLTAVTGAARPKILGGLWLP